jgi:glycolate oxidase
MNRTPEAVLTELSAVVRDGRVISAAPTLERFRSDAVPSAADGRPLAAVLARSTEDVRQSLRWAGRHRIAVTTRGAGTGLSGGAAAVDGGLVMCLEEMTGIRIDPSARVATVGAGALNGDVKDAARKHGLHYPPDPASFRTSSIGGNIATNAGGLCCVKYGVTAAYVLGLEVVLADGTVLRLGGRTVKDVAGLPLLPLFVGSEGALGIVTRADLRLVPEPAPSSTVAAVFPTLEAAGAAVVEIGRCLSPSMLELLDQTTINCLEDLRPAGLDRDAGALLIAQVDASGSGRVDECRLLSEICEKNGADEVNSTDDPDEGEMFIEVRRNIGRAYEMRGALIAGDVVVPIDRLPQLLRAVHELDKTVEVEVPVAAHAGDGNVHPTVIYDPARPGAEDAAWRVCDDIMRIAVDLGGTIAGEHGIGRKKRHMLDRQLGGDVMRISQAVKDLFDPEGLLNPGVLV